MYICIAGKNNCAIDAIKFLLKKKININRILALPNYNDKGIDDWQPSFKKFALKNKIKIIKLKNLYVIKKLLFFSLEYEKIINIHKFQSKKLYNLHFSLLPKYRGCHTNFLQIYKGERFSGVTLHKIDNGIDTGEIIDQKRFKIKINDTAYQNYIKLMELSVKIFKRNLFKIINNNYKTKKQKLSNGSYFSRNSVNYNKISKFKVKNFNIKMHNKIRSLIFPAYQLPEVNGVKIVKSIYKNKKVNLIEYNDR
jgi:methionyl-tRNA formyltransferase